MLSLVARALVKELIGGNIFATPTMTAAKGMLLATPLQALGEAVSASLACQEEMVPQKCYAEHYRQRQEQMLKKVLNIEQT